MLIEINGFSLRRNITIEQFMLNLNLQWHCACHIQQQEYAFFVIHTTTKSHNYNREFHFGTLVAFVLIMKKINFTKQVSSFAVLILSGFPVMSDESNEVQCPKPLLVTALESNSTQLSPLEKASFEIVRNKMQDIQDKLTRDFCSTNSEDWIEASSQEETAYIHALTKWRAFQKSRNPHLNNLQLTELFAIELYAGFFYQVVNPLLFKAKEDEVYLEQISTILASQQPNAEKLKYSLIAVISHGLNKLPSYKKILYRSAFSPMSTSPGVALKKSQEHFDQYDPANPKKNIYSFAGFMSTTKGEGEHAKETFVNSANLLLVIEQNQSGRQIHMISSRPEEEEILFLPFSKFIVTKKETVQGADGNLQYKMYLSEIKK